MEMLSAVRIIDGNTIMPFLHSFQFTCMNEIILCVRCISHVNIYEMHLGSWRHKEDGEPMGYLLYKAEKKQKQAEKEKKKPQKPEAQPPAEA